jgi:Transposase IS66 family
MPIGGNFQLLHENLLDITHISSCTKASRSGEVPKRLLAGFSGYLMTDGYEGYNSLSARNGVKRL